MMNNEKNCAEIAHTVGAVLRKDLLKRANELKKRNVNIPKNSKKKDLQELLMKLDK